MDQTRNVAVLVYEGVDTLDMAGPFDVFAVSSNWGKDLCVYTVGERAAPVTTVSGVTVVPRYTLADCPAPDVLVVPGGLGSRREMHNEALTAWIRAAAGRAELVLSVCTGALLLAKAGLLGGLRITTNRRAFDLLEAAAPASAEIVRDVRYVDNGKVVMSGGVTTGMDAALHIVARLFGTERARTSAELLEYEWRPEAPPTDQPASGRPASAPAGPSISPPDMQAADGLHIRRARHEDMRMLQALYMEAADWIRDTKGIRQWRPEMFSDARIEQLFREQDVYAAYMDGRLAGGFSIHWGFEEIWGDRYSEDAGHVHRLAVARAFKGLGLGSRLLQRAERIIGERGKTWLRLDCMADNPSLNAYYMRQGLRHCGRYDGDGWSANLYERSVSLQNRRASTAQV